MKPANSTLLRHVSIRRPRLRIHVSVFEEDKTGELAILINTRRLVGPWQDRHITRTDIVYSLESFLALHSAFNLIENDPLFRRKMNRFAKDFELNPFKGSTSCKQ